MKKYPKKQVCLQAADGTAMYDQPRTILTSFEKHQIGSRSGVVDFKKIVARALKFLQSREHELLFNYIAEVLPTERMKSEFLAQQGHLILQYVFAYSSNMDVLSWIYDNFSKTSILAAVQANHDSVLEKFFIFQYGAELSSLDNYEYRKLRIEEFKFLLSIDQNIVKTFMDRNSGSSFITTKIQEDYYKAVLAINNSNIQLSII